MSSRALSIGYLVALRLPVGPPPRVPPYVAHYYKRREVEELFADLPLSECEIHHNQGYSWTVLCTKA